MTEIKNKSKTAFKPDPSQHQTNLELIKRLSQEEDGKDHINIYSRGQTSLGRLLSHFASTYFSHPVYGPFDSMEGFWYYMRSKEKDDQLRYLSGFAAKEYGRVLEPAWYEQFWEDILAANYQKVIQNPHIKQALIASELPFQHYYIHYPQRGNTARPLIVLPRDFQMLVDGMEEIRKALKEDRPSKHWARAEKRYAAAASDNLPDRTLNPEASVPTDDDPVTDS
jgi:hypothetical protein